MPQFLNGILEIYQGPVGKGTTYTSSTAYNYTIGDDIRNYLSTGPLKYSVDVYKFIKSLFWQKIRANKIR